MSATAITYSVRVPVLLRQEVFRLVQSERLAPRRRRGVKVRHFGERRDPSSVPRGFTLVVVHGGVDTDTVVPQTRVAQEVVSGEGAEKLTAPVIGLTPRCPAST